MRMTPAIGLLLIRCLVTELDGQGTSPPVKRLPDSYLLQGIVRDSSSGAPVAGVRIWPYLKGWGALSDDEGRYKLRWSGQGTWTFLVRLCEDRNLTSFGVTFLPDSVLHRDIRIAASGQPACTSSDRLPWAVDSSDATSFTGHYTYSWEGGGRLQACGGATYSPDWDSALGRRLRQRQQHEVSFVRFIGRVALDRLDDGLAPGYIRINYPGPLFLVNKIDAVRDPRPEDCH